MDQQAKKVLCCEMLKALVATYAGLAEGATQEELKTMNEAADRSVADLKSAFESVIATRRPAPPRASR